MKAWTALAPVFCVAYALVTVGCTAGQRDTARKYAYLYCKVRDADPILHQTVDAMVPVVGDLANVTVSTGCVLIESYAERKPTVTAIPAGSTISGTAQ